MIYLASPFSHRDKRVRARRFKAVCQHAAKMIQAGHVVFSPMAHSLPIAEHAGLPTQDFEFWREYDEAMIRQSLLVIVLALPGWEKSKGVQHEIEFAKANGIPVTYKTP